MLNIAVHNYHLHSITSRVILCTLINIKLKFFSDEAVCLGAVACNSVVIELITAANEHTIQRARQHNVRQQQTYFYYNEYINSIPKQTT